MDETGKLTPGIIGITICMILLVAVALPIISGMSSTIVVGEGGNAGIVKTLVDILPVILFAAMIILIVSWMGVGGKAEGFLKPPNDGTKEKRRWTRLPL